MSTQRVLEGVGKCMAVIVGAALGAATGATLGAAWTEIVVPVTDFVAPSASVEMRFVPPAIAILVGSSLGAFAELAAIFKHPLAHDPEGAVARVVWLGVVGVIGLWIRLEAGGEFAPALLPMACLPAALLWALVKGTQWVPNQGGRGAGHLRRRP